MPDEDRPEQLRIGGWVPPYRDTKGPLRPPVPPRRRGAAGLTAALWTGPIRRHTTSGLGRRVIAAAATGAVIAVVGLTALALRGGDDDSKLVQRVVLPPYTPSAPVSILPAPTAGSSSGPGSITRSPTRHRETEATTTTRPAKRAPTSKPPTTTPAARLVAGVTVGLEHADYPGYRLRHHDFAARFDALDAGSRRSDRQDSRFTVRRGLASSGCFSLESVNFPGYYLRHRNYELHLDRRDGSDLFDKDGTFCTRPVRSGTAIILESVNYPGYFLVGSNRGVRIERVSTDRATAFLIRAAL